MEEHTIRARIVELETAHDEIVAEANNRIALIIGGIAELKRLLEPKTEPMPTEVIEAPAV